MKREMSARRFRCAMTTLVLAALCLSGCATELTFRRREALDSFIGQDRGALEQLLGQPTKTTSQGGIELLTYRDNELKWMPGEPGVRDGNGVPIGPWVDKTHCATTFRLENGRVDAWRLDGNDCRNPDFPPLGGGDRQALAAAADRGVSQVADYPHNSFTGRSVVNYGEFQTQ